MSANKFLLFLPLLVLGAYGQVVNPPVSPSPYTNRPDVATNIGSLTITALATPSAPTVVATCTGTCVTSYTYEVVALLGDSTHTPASSASSGVNNATALTTSKFNTVTTISLSNSYSCDVYRVTPSGQKGKIGNVLCGNSLADKNLTPDGNDPPSTNTTGGGTVAGTLTMGATVLPLGIVSTAKYANTVVTVPAPTVAPTLSSTDVWGGAGLTAGHVYHVAYSYVGWSGESALSPAASFTAINGQGIVVLPLAPLGTGAVGAKIYMCDNTVSCATLRRPTLWHNDPPDAANDTSNVQFGDVGPWGGASVQYYASGTAFPATNNALNVLGVSISAPVSAPVVTAVGALPLTTTLYAAYSYVGQDGAETALSPVSTSVTTSSSAPYATIFIPRDPPSGAVFANLYLGTATNAMHFQRQVGLHAVRNDMHIYDAAGIANVAGTPQSTISPLQQAWDAALELGGATVYVHPGPMNTTVPIILRNVKANGAPAPGMALVGSLNHDSNVSSSRARINYTGTQAGVDLVVSTVGHAHIANIDFWDPNNRVACGLCYADFNGGESNNTVWDNVGFSAFQTGGIACKVGIESGSNNSHTASEQSFHNLSCSGDAWGLDMHGQQTVDFSFDGNSSFYSNGNGNASANSGHIRLAGMQSITFSRTGFIGTPQYNLLLTGEHSLISGGGNTVQFSGATFFKGLMQGIAVSPLAYNPNAVLLSNVGTDGGASTIFLYANAPTTLSMIASSVSGPVYLDHPSAVISQSGQQDQFAGATLKATSPTYVKPSVTLHGALAAVNPSKNVTTYGTNAAGDAVITPFSGHLNGVTSLDNVYIQPSAPGTGGTFDIYPAIGATSSRFRFNAKPKDPTNQQYFQVQTSTSDNLIHFAVGAGGNGANMDVDLFGGATIRAATTSAFKNFQLDSTTVTGAGTCNAGALGKQWAVTDSLAPAIGVTVTNGGSAKAMIWCNGANWTVTGI